MKLTFKVILTVLAALTLPACFNGTKVSLLGKFPEPLQETHVLGDKDAQNKIAVLELNGAITYDRGSCIGSCEASPVAAILARLELAAKDENVKAVVLKLDTPGGGVAPSDLLFEELKKFRAKTNKPVVAFMDEVAASGGVYVAMGADYVIASPTTITGSIGVIFQRADLTGLIAKIGVKMPVYKSGEHKDMGSPFKDEKESAKDDELFTKLVMDFYDRFVSVVAEGRKMRKEEVLNIADGRIYTAKDALSIKLIDQIGDLQDAWKKAAQLAKIDADKSRLVMYRNYRVYNDTPYGPAAMVNADQFNASLFDGVIYEKLGLMLKPGFYYVCPALTATAE